MIPPSPTAQPSDGEIMKIDLSGVLTGEVNEVHEPPK
jgi:hypothetical protein